MKKTIRVFGLALAVLMILPMLAALPVKVNATEPAPTYDAAHDGELLRAVNFKSEDWYSDYAGGISGSNHGADVAVSDDGTSVTFTVQNANNRRAMWGGYYTDAADDSPEDIAYHEALGAALPMKAGVKYTMVFDLKLGNDGVAFGISVDGENALNICGSGQTYWYGWNTLQVNATQDDNEKWNYHYASGSTKRDKQTFAVVLDYDAKTMTLYIVDTSDGCFYLCRSLYFDGAKVWDSSYLRCRLTARRISGTPNSSFTAEVSNLNVYKGNALKLVSGNSYQLPYWSHPDGDELLGVNFEDTTFMTPALSENNNYNDLGVAVDGGSVTFTSLGTDSKRGVWGDTLPADFFPLSAGVKYTVYFSLTMDAGMKCAFYPDGTQGIAIIQNSTYTKYQSWATMSGAEANWANKTDCKNGLKNFAVTLDYDTGTLTLYGENRNGLYSYINQATGLTFGGDALGVYFFAGNTEDGTVTVSDVSIEKGLTVPILDAGAIGYTAYQAAADNSLLRTVNFKQDGFNPAFADNNNKGADVEVSNDGTTVTFTVQNANNKRAMWGDYLVDALPLYGGANAQNGVQYTFMYDVILGNENVGFGLQVDGNNALVVDGAGNVLWYEWNTKKVSASAEESKNWINHTDVAPTAKQTFTVTMDYNANNFTLYVKRSNGTFEKVRSMTYNNCDWAGSRVRPRFYIRTIDTGIAPDATYTAAVSNLRIFKGTDFSDLYVLQNASGAAVRLNTPTGLRFTGLIGKGLLNELKAEYGEANVKVGMLITPTDYLTANSLAFTKEALDACGALPAGKKYVKITASTILESDDGCAYKINCVLANVREANYDRNFSAVTFVEINGSTYLYGDYSEAANSRSITFVAEAALSDVSDVQTGEYQYAVDGKYSPYTSAQRALLVGFRCPNYISVMNYNIEEIEGNDDQSRTPAKAVQTILDLSPDIVGLQEVDEEWNLSDLTSNGYGRVQGDTNRDMWTELYYKTAKFNKLNSGYKRYSALESEFPGVDKNGADTGRDKLGRMFTWARLEEKASGKIVLAITTHLHYRQNKDDTASTEPNSLVREYEVRLLLAWIEAQVFNYDCVVITGDMNAHCLSGLGRNVINVYKDGGYDITRDTAEVKGDTDGTLANSGRTTRPEWIFDYILTRGSVETVYFTVVDNKIDKNGTAYPSDHLPVLARILVH
ncbi:MAG: endonuclease/exonuclease/phosphatase family protein [Clostridia bacterium]|nr:endonuclease/exonuclease/phosphatase family protein [Clostridia bacterium]